MSMPPHLVQELVQRDIASASVALPLINEISMGCRSPRRNNPERKQASSSLMRFSS